MKCWIATITLNPTPAVLVYDFDYLPDEATVILDYIKREYPDGVDSEYIRWMMEREVYIEESQIITS